MSALPFVIWLCVSISGSVVADHVIKSGIIPVFKARMVWQLTALLGCSFFLVLLAFAASSKHIALLLLCLAVGISGLHTSGYVPNVLEVAGPYASFVNSLSNTAGTVPGIFGVGITGFILDRTDHDWTVVWLIAASINLGGAVVLYAWASPHPIFPTTPSTENVSNENSKTSSSADSSSGASGSDETGALLINTHRE